ncbi:FAD-binding domain-containing protein [Siphonobacter sp. SORGH_AS_1065]|uniref:FAD-binding domain-containing protein n=1 Tax=Siphonobacter sp. SORGH_AS_1065 TaxID=3041795 RepID=UPI002789DFE9|nr:FAD-binding domain-containing protein [Siphonobacter sp. SORGH_AS_1065]MDQ1089456.1 deoxyribodipyrimidine photo-lyase [Siphonobacter sp. SORGH_AS_1065]
MNILWFQRDLRLADHAPLQAAIEAGQPLLLLYCYEPALLSEGHFNPRHGRFIMESLQNLNSILKNSGIVLHVFRNDFLAVLKKIHRRYGVGCVFSYRERGLNVLEHRNAAIEAFCDENEIQWHASEPLEELPLAADWKKFWQKEMKKPVMIPDLSKLKPASVSIGFIEELAVIDTPDHYHIPDFHFQRGGPEQAEDWLNSFLKIRAVQYLEADNNPYLSRYNASRLSPYISWGNISVRQVFQASQQAMKEGFYPKALKEFLTHLYKRDHILFTTHQGYACDSEDLGTTADENQQRLFDRWKTGTLGFPLVDAAMRCLLETGYLIPRLRSLLRSVLKQRLPEFEARGLCWLAQHSLDFEPRLFYYYASQPLGSRTFLNPVKESHTMPSSIHFMRIWLPELVALPPRFLHEPWLLKRADQNRYSVWLGSSYPVPPKEWIPRRMRKKKLQSRLLSS